MRVDQQTHQIRARRLRPSAAFLLLTAPLGLGLAATAAPVKLKPTAAVMPVAASPVSFNREIRPILSDNCYACHGADPAKRQGGLRLDLAAEALKPGASGKPALVPGRPEASELLRRVTATNALAMPPASTHKKLTVAQVNTLRRWMKQGATYQEHWAYTPLTMPPLPSGPMASRNPIDGFVRARLQREGLSPSPVADRRTLIRRLSFDLTGLPPTAAEVEAFVKDAAPGAYERVVDRLLASPRFGERMAVYWLDLVRYADTVGYHGDQDVTVWPYRDYVIKSFNEDKPFDQFTREQLAGDLLPNRTREQQVASGYNRLGMMSAEGGVQDKEYRAKYASDRVRNASGVWLGSTIGCAECHDHKFDPFTAKDFYRFAAFWSDLKEKGFYDGGFGRGDWGPSLRLPSTEQQQRLEALEREINTAKQALAAVPESSLAEGRAAWEAKVRALDTTKALAWKPVKPEEATSSGGSTLTVNADASVTASGALPAWDSYTVVLPPDAIGDRPVTALRVEALPDGEQPGNGIARAGYYFVLSEVEVQTRRPGEAAQPIVTDSVVVNGESDGYPGGALIDGNRRTGWAMVNGGARTAVIRFSQPIKLAPEQRLVVTLHHETRARLHVGRFRLSVSGAPGAELGPQSLPDPVLAAVRKESAARTPAETQLLSQQYRAIAGETAQLRTRLDGMVTARGVLLGEIPHTLVSEATEPRPVRVLPRGNWMDDSGEVVQAGTPGFMKQVAREGRANRLDLAEWMVARENPLTARVFANRMWKLFFGSGLSKTLEEVGAQGEPPVHPELLDYLAVKFSARPRQMGERGNGGKGDPIGFGWRIKPLIRLLVTSDTYRQSSAATPQLLARDPYNRFYARQATFRLDAEFVRDHALAASGLLSQQLGGRSVFPYQPRGYLAPLNFPRREWAADAGDELYRRSLYIHWQRTFLHPGLVAFDAPTREECTATRTVSNTPMQSLVLLNDPIFVEAARVLAARVLREGGRTWEERLAWTFRTVLSRDPRPEEVSAMRKLHQQQKARYLADRPAAQALIAVGEAPVPKTLDPVDLATWTAACRVIFNTHEAVTRS